MKRDKKVSDGRIRLVLLESIGRAKLCPIIPTVFYTKYLTDTESMRRHRREMFLVQMLDGCQ